MKFEQFFKYMHNIPDNIVIDKHEKTGKWTFQYLTDDQAKLCLDALTAMPRRK